MDTPASGSFIPKKPLTGGSTRGGSATLGIFIFFIAILVFVASLIAAGGAFAYKGFLKAALAQKSDELQKAEAAFDSSTIQDLMRLDSRLNNTEALLQKHSTALALFTFLSQQTLENVQFTTFDYELQPDGSAQLSLEGVASSFATIALQSDQFNASQVLKDVVFSGITVGGANKVAFTVKATVDPSLLSYAKSLSSAPVLNVDPSTQSAPPGLPQ